MYFSILKNSMRYLDNNVFNRRISILKKKFSRELISINLDISGSCNLNCIMCSFKKWYPKETKKEISNETLEKLRSVIPKIESISLHCNCEPLLNKNVISIIKYIKGINPKILLSFTTNGTLLNTSLSGQLIDSGLDRIVFSIDGSSAKTYEKIRLGADFEKVVCNLEEFINIKKQKSSKLPEVGIISVASKDNIFELTKIVKLAIELGIDSISINGLEPYTKEMSTLVLYDRIISEDYEEIYANLRKLAKEKGIRIGLSSLVMQPYKFCDLKGCVIDSEGEVYTCSVLSYKRPYYYLGMKLVHPQKSFGNINEKSFYEIWNSKEYKMFRKELLKGNLPEYCKKCLIKNGVLCPV